MSPAGVWVIAARGNELVLIDPSATLVVRRVPVRGARSLAVTGKTLWVGLSRLALLGRVDAEGASLVHVPGHSPDGYGPALLGGASLWVGAGGRLGTVNRSGRVSFSARLPGVREIGGLAVGLDAWIADRRSGKVLRIRLPRVDGRLVASFSQRS